MGAHEEPGEIPLRLRRELEILPGPAGDDGSPTALLFDPFFGTFDRMGWAEYEVVRRLRNPIGFDGLLKRLTRETTIHPDAAELKSFIGQLHHRGLLEASRFREPEVLEREAEAGQVGTARWLLANYLFFRIPLAHPHAFLRATDWVPRILGSSAMLLVYLGVAITGLIMFVPRSGQFWEQALPFIAWRGAVWLGLSLAAVKAVHEFSHAYAASSRGVAVRSMGIAMMLMFPIPYTDVTDAWRLDRRGRLAITTAGVRSELAVAALALFFWSLLPPGLPRDVCFFLCTASVLSTLFTNLNPGMRFDGYYLLSDLLGIDNLQQRGFSHARKVFRQFFFGLAASDDEAGLPGWKRAAMVLYAVYACVYRLGLYFGIALLVYYTFPKILGVFLFSLEMAVFIVRPVLREVVEVASMTRKRGFSTRMALSTLAAALFIGWLAAPLPRRERIGAVIATDGEYLIYVPAAGRLAENRLSRDARIPAGEVVLRIDNPELDLELEWTALALEGAGLQVDAALSGLRDRDRIREYLAEQSRLLSVVASKEKKRRRSTFLARADCLVLDANESLREGVCVAEGMYAGRIVEAGALRMAVAYLEEIPSAAIRPGSLADFVPESDPGLAVPLRIGRIFQVAAGHIGEEALTEPYGGNIPVRRNRKGGMEPVMPLYRLESDPLEGDFDGRLRLGQRGELVFYGPPRSYAVETVRWLYRTLLRESGF